MKKLSALAIILIVLSSSVFGVSKGYLLLTDLSRAEQYPRFVKITKTYTDFATAGLTNDVEILSSPAKGVIFTAFAIPSVAFSGGTIISYTISLGVSGNHTKFTAANDVFTGFTPVLTSSADTTVESMSGTTSIRAYATAIGANLDQASAGSIDFYVVVSYLE